MASNPGPGQVTAQTAFRATVAVTTITFISHVLGLGREAAMAATFGAGWSTDAYFVALMVPTLLTTIFTLCIPTVGISILGEFVYQTDRRAELQTVVWSIFHLVLAFAAALAVASAIFLPSIMHRLAPGFTPNQLELASRLVRILAGILIFNGLISWCQSVLQVSQKFTPPAVSNIFFNIVLIAAILMSGQFGGIFGLAWGMLAATATQFAFQFPFALRSVPEYKCVLQWSHPAVRKMAVQSVPVIVRVAAHLATTLVERLLASHLVVGSISALNFAFLTFQIPISTIGIPLTTVLYSAMTAFRAGGDTERFKRAYVRGLKMIALIFITVAAWLIVFRVDFVRLLFQRGSFDAAATDLTARALLFYSIGAVFAVWVIHTINAMAALQDFVTPLWASLAAFAVNCLFNFAAVDPLAIGGLALGTSIRYVVWFFLMAWQMRRRIGPIGESEIALACIKITASAVISIAAVAALRFGGAEPFWIGLDQQLIAPFGERWGLIASLTARLTLLGLLYLALFSLVSKIFCVKETDELIDLVREYMHKRKTGGNAPSS